MTRRRTLFLVAVLLQAGLLALLVASEEWNLTFGTRVELAVEGRDPLDPLAGTYQDVTLAIERLPRSLARDAAPVAPGDRIHVLLRSGENGHVADGYTVREPSPESDLHLRGTVRRVLEDEIQVDYGLDRYYVPAGARDPSLDRDVDLRLVVLVRADGRGTIEDLLVDGVPFDEWNRGR